MLDWYVFGLASGPPQSQTTTKRPGVAVHRAFVLEERIYPKICLRRSPTNPNKPKPKSMLVDGSGVVTSGLPVSNMAPLFAVALIVVSSSSVPSAMNPTI